MRMAHDFRRLPAPPRSTARSLHIAARVRKKRAALLRRGGVTLRAFLPRICRACCSGDRLEVSVSEPESHSGSAALACIGPVAANALLRCGVSGETALLSFDFATAIALTDRSFGGNGKQAGHAPDQLPRSAALLVDEIAATIRAGHHPRQPWRRGAAFRHGDQRRGDRPQ